ncbi:MAG TPA: hypothetical protein VGB26_09835 [Nitrospiria bacterium]
MIFRKTPGAASHSIQFWLGFEKGFFYRERKPGKSQFWVDRHPTDPLSFIALR